MLSLFRDNIGQVFSGFDVHLGGAGCRLGLVHAAARGAGAETGARARACSGAPRRERTTLANPVDRLTRGLPHRCACTIDWVVTIAGAIAIVLAIKAWVVNPYRIPSSSMEPTLHCARAASGCEARFSDRVLANRFIYRFRDPQRGDIVVFETPPAAKARCGAGGTFVKRLIGLPGERVELRNDRRLELRLHQREAARGAVHPAESARHARRRVVQGAARGSTS